MEVAQNLAEAIVLGQRFLKQHAPDMVDTEFKVLVMLRVHGDCSPKVLVQKTGILKTNLALILKKLQTEGLVVSGVNMEDARSKVYVLTDVGCEKIDSVLESARKDLGEVITEDFFYAIRIVCGVLNKK